MSKLGDISRAAKAESLLNDPVIKEALNEIRHAYVDQLVSAPIHDLEGIQRLKVMVHMADKFKEVLYTYVNSGKIAEDQLKLSEKPKRGLRFGR